MTQGWQRVALYEYLTASSLRVDSDINELSLLSRCLAWPGLEISLPMFIGSSWRLRRTAWFSFISALQNNSLAAKDLYDDLCWRQLDCGSKDRTKLNRYSLYLRLSRPLIIYWSRVVETRSAKTWNIETSRSARTLLSTLVENLYMLPEIWLMSSSLRLSEVDMVNVFERSKGQVVQESVFCLPRRST